MAKGYEVTAGYVVKTGSAVDLGHKLEAMRKTADENGLQLQGYQVTTIDIPDQAPSDQ